MGDVFYWVLNMSIAGAITGTVILLLRRIKSIPKRYIYPLWLIPFMRFFLPVGIGGKYGLMPFLSRFAVKSVTLSDGYYFDYTYMNYIRAADDYFPNDYKNYAWKIFFEIGGFIWITVAVALVILFFIIYFSTKNELKDELSSKEKIIYSDKLRTPAVYGIFRSHIVLPQKYRDRDLTYVLMHENTHIRRADNFWRTAAFMCAAIHWYNPLVWLFLRRCLEDCEFSCDESVLRKCGADFKKDYASSLLDCAESGNVFVSAFGGAKIRVRLENILSYRKLSLISSVCFFIFAVILAVLLLVNAK